MLAAEASKNHENATAALPRWIAAVSAATKTSRSSPRRNGRR